jgi:hypothetical protein
METCKAKISWTSAIVDKIRYGMGDGEDEAAVRNIAMNDVKLLMTVSSDQGNEVVFPSPRENERGLSTCQFRLSIAARVGAELSMWYSRV